MEGLQKQVEDHENRIRALEQDRAETKVYMKMTLDKITQIDAKFENIRSEQLKNSKKSEDSKWSPIILELIKLATLAVTILGGIAGVAKILDK